MSAPVPSDELLRFVPRFVAEQLQSRLELELSAPRITPAALLFADLSGFTELTERHMQRGAEGLEELIATLNTYFAQLVDAVLEEGGDICKFAGDSVIALWPAADEQRLEGAILAASRCALRFQERFAGAVPAKALARSPRITVTAGEMVVGVQAVQPLRSEVLIGGDALMQVARTERLATPGAVVLSDEAWRRVSAHCEGAPVGPGAIQVSAVPPRRGELALPPLGTEAGGARRFVPQIVLRRLHAGHGGWIAELRPVTVAFISLPAVVDGASLRASGALLRAASEVVAGFGGTVNKVAADEKGSFIIAAWGLPPDSHEDDPARAIRAAVEVRARLSDLGWRASIGVSTGRAFCGLVGSPKRCEYTVIGRVMNDAARLMAPGVGEVLISESTREAAGAQWTVLPVSVDAKGRAMPAFRISGVQPGPGADAPPLAGRERERDLLIRRIEQLRVDGRGGIAVIEGEAGIGKSRLLTVTLNHVRTLGLPWAAGAADPLEHRVAYRAWAHVVRRLLELPREPTPEQVRVAAADQLGRLGPHWLRLAPLLNAVLGIGPEENELTSHIAGEARANWTQDLLLTILRSHLGPGEGSRGAVLAIEDLQWLDSTSWTLLRRVRRELPGLLIIATTRPLGSELPQANELRSDEQLLHLRLQPLNRAAVDRMACELLGVSSIPPALGALLMARGEGHPFFTEELLHSLRESGNLQVADGICRVPLKPAELAAVEVPATVTGAVTERIDRLPAGEQLTLKVASVIGRVFAFSAVQAIYPVQDERAALRSYLEQLDRKELTLRHPGGAGLSYRFKHQIIEKVAYELMLVSQRRELHRAVGEWYERTYAGDLTPHLPALAYHWARAAVSDRARDYLIRAGEQALRSFANAEALRFFDEALALAPPEGALEPARRAAVERQIGEAHFGLGDLAGAREHLVRGLALLGESVPGPKGLGWATVRELLRQLLRRRRRAPGPGEAQPDESRVEAARLYELLAELAFFANETGPLVHAVLRTINLAEDAGRDRELALGAVDAGLVAGLIPAHGLARKYLARASAALDRLDDLNTRAHVLRVASIYRIGAGELEVSLRLLQEAVALTDRLGDRRRWGECSALLAFVQEVRGKLDASRATYEELRTASATRGDAQQEAWGLGGSATIVGRGPDAGLARELAERALPLYPATDRIARPNALSALATAALRQGDVEPARAAALEVLEILSSASPTAVTMLPAYADTCAVLLRLARSHPVEGSQRAATQALAALDRYAKVFPIGKSRALLARGQWAYDQGKLGRALRHWQAAVKAADALTLPWDEAVAQRALSLAAPQKWKADHARRVLEQMGVDTGALLFGPPAEPAR